MRHPAFPARASGHRNVSSQAITRELENLGMLGTVKKASSAIREGRLPIFFPIRRTLERLRGPPVGRLRSPDERVHAGFERHAVLGDTLSSGGGRDSMSQA